MQRRPAAGRAVLALLVLALLYGARELLPELPRGVPATFPPPGSTAAAPAPEGEARILALFREERSGEAVEVAGRVSATLPDDREGSPHQRFVLRLAGGHTLLVSHNIALAQRVPLERGDAVRIRGQYEWNPRGGVVHWTHHDPDGRQPGGWIEHRGQRYR